MNKFKKSQVLMLFLLAITPLISSSLRSTYLFFVSNIIIITLGAEAGIFSVFLKPLEETKQSLSVILRPLIPFEATSVKREPSTIVSEHVEESLKLVENLESEKGPSTSSLFFIGKREASTIVSEHVEKKLELVENSESERVISVTLLDKVQKGPSRSSLFIIGNGEDDSEVMEEETNEAEEDVGGVNGKELFAKAEAFIGLFYKQLKMQREEYRTLEKAL